jgi:hypothetical protein
MGYYMQLTGVLIRGLISVNVLILSGGFFDFFQSLRAMDPSPQMPTFCLDEAAYTCQYPWSPTSQTDTLPP